MLQKLTYVFTDKINDVDQYVLDTYRYFTKRLKDYCPNDYESFRVIYYCNYKPYLFYLNNWDKQVKIQTKYHNQYISDWSKFHLGQWFLCTDKYVLYVVDKVNENNFSSPISIEYDPENILTKDKLIKIFDELRR